MLQVYFARAEGVTAWLLADSTNDRLGDQMATVPFTALAALGSRVAKS